MAGGRKITAHCAAAFLLTFAADQASKFAVLRLGYSASFNSGVSFGFFSGAKPLTLTALNIAVAALLLFLAVSFARERGAAFRIGCGMMLGGAAGNLADRLFRGRVTDWLPLPFSDLFFSNGLWVNAADIFLILGSAALFFDIVKEIKWDS
ncbi:MAG: signal peptidase II [Synergistaceae bacterium]|nr:signal peptidase II [Synergistaceae bacterium]